MLAPPDCGDGALARELRASVSRALRIDGSGAFTKRVEPRIAPTYEGDKPKIGTLGRRNLEARCAAPLAA